MSEPKKYAVIQLVGKQYTVTEGEQLKVANVNLKKGETLTINDVLLLVDGDKRQIGTPLVKGASVSLEVVDNKKDKKIRVATYRAKSRSRKVKGHRSAISLLNVVKITAK